VGCIPKNDGGAAVMIWLALDANQWQMRVPAELRNKLGRIYKRSDARKVVVKERRYSLWSGPETFENQARCEKGARERAVLSMLMYSSAREACPALLEYEEVCDRLTSLGMAINMNSFPGQMWR